MSSFLHKCNFFTATPRKKFQIAEPHFVKIEATQEKVKQLRREDSKPFCHLLFFKRDLWLKKFNAEKSRREGLMVWPPFEGGGAEGCIHSPWLENENSNQ